MLLRTTFFLLLISFLFPKTICAQHHATVNGSPNGSGSLEDPMDLKTLLKDNKTVQAGDTIFIHEGVYNGNFVTYVRGEKGKPVVICPYENDYVVIDQKTENPAERGIPGIGVNFSYVQFRDLVLNGSPNGYQQRQK